VPPVSPSPPPPTALYQSPPSAIKGSNPPPPRGAPSSSSTFCRHCTAVLAVTELLQTATFGPPSVSQLTPQGLPDNCPLSDLSLASLRRSFGLLPLSPSADRVPLQLAVSGRSPPQAPIPDPSVPPACQNSGRRRHESHGARLPCLGLGPKCPVGWAVVARQACGQMALAHSNSAPSQFPFGFIQFQFNSNSNL
jgi:hypothetical protein